MKRPTESDFEINVMGAGVEAIFKPTRSHYSYNRLVDEKDIARFGPISPARVRHAGPTGLIMTPRMLRQWRCVWRQPPSDAARISTTSVGRGLHGKHEER